MFDQVGPVENVRVVLYIVPLHYPSPHGLHKKSIHYIGKLGSGPIECTLSTFDHEQSEFFVLLNMVQDIITKPRKIAGNGLDTTSHSFERSITPRLIIAGKYSQVAASDELIVIHSEKRTARRDKIGMVYDLNRVICIIHQLLCMKGL